MQAMLDASVFVVTDSNGKPCCAALSLDAAYSYIDSIQETNVDDPTDIEYVNTILTRYTRPKHSIVTYRDKRDGATYTYTVWEL